MKLLKKTIVLCLILFGFDGAVAFSQDSGSLPEAVQKLNVGILPLSPFTYVAKGQQTGIAYDIWSLVSIDNYFENHYVNLDNDLNAAVAKVQSGELDVVIGPVALDWNLAKQIDFSMPYFRGEYVLLAKKVKMHVWQRFNEMFSGNLFIYLGFFVALYVLYLNIFLWLERNKIEELTDKSYLAAFDLLLWKSVLSRIQRPPFLPTSITVRMLSLVWLIICGVFFVSVLSGLTASLFSGLSSSGETLRNITDMKGKVVTVFGGVGAVESAIQTGLDVKSSQDSMEKAIQLLDTGKTDAIYTLLGFAEVYLKEHHRQDLYISPIKLPHIYLGFIFNKKFNYLLPNVNLSIMKMSENGQKSLICSKYEGLIDENNCKT